MYSQLFLISINEKAGFFKPIMFEFPEDQNSYEDIESKIMFGEAFLLCAFYDVKENDKEFVLPNITFNRYPNGKPITSMEEKNYKVKLSGKLDEIHLFLREGFIIPKQNTFEKYILNTMKLREEKLDLVINIDYSKQSQGVLFFDNDDKDTIKEKAYYKVDLNFLYDKLVVHTYKNQLTKYNYNDHILGNIELWNINNVLKNEGDKNKKYNCEISYLADLNKNKEIIEGVYDAENNKIIFDISKKVNDASLFDIKDILFNF
jgi:alpha-glucosidase (family GH31 glycosyl hydrolase)